MSKKDVPQMKKEALLQLKGKWIKSLLFTFAILVIPTILNFIPFGAIASIIIAGPLAFASATYFIALAKYNDPSFDILSVGFKKSSDNIALYLLVLIYTFLWSLLLFIPGIVKSISYSLAFYIKAETPELTVDEAILASMKMTNGYKFEIAFFMLAFIGWFIPYLAINMFLFLNLIPLLMASNSSISVIFLAQIFSIALYTPLQVYISTTFANYYLDLKERYRLKAEATRVPEVVSEN